MKRKLYALLLIFASLMVGCGGNDNSPVVETTVDEVVVDVTTPVGGVVLEDTYVEAPAAELRINSNLTQLGYCDDGVAVVEGYITGTKEDSVDFSKYNTNNDVLGNVVGVLYVFENTSTEDKAFEVDFTLVSKDGAEMAEGNSSHFTPILHPGETTIISDNLYVESAFADIPNLASHVLIDIEDATEYSNSYNVNNDVVVTSSKEVLKEEGFEDRYQYVSTVRNNSGRDLNTMYLHYVSFTKDGYALEVGHMGAHCWSVDDMDESEDKVLYKDGEDVFNLYLSPVDEVDSCTIDNDYAFDGVDCKVFVEASYEVD